MSRSRKILLVILVLCACVAFDQITKSIARERLASLPTIHLLGDTFRFQYIENTGAFLGLGARMSEAVRFWSFTVLVGAVLLGLLGVVLISRELSLMGIVGGTLIVSGGLSNLIDRLLNDGAVIDFMNMGIGRVRTGIFNVADVAIMVGMGALLVDGLLNRTAEQDEEVEPVS